VAREGAFEQARILDLMRLVPQGLHNALDLGARDGYVSMRLTEHVSHVTALDLEAPSIEHDRIATLGGDATSLEFSDSAFDLVMCAEVLEHIPRLETACAEIVRVTRRFALIGVPYRQDIRFGRTTCERCGVINPPWGHVNTFDETRLRTLFGKMQCVRTSFVGLQRDRTNALSAWLNNRAGNPWGTYEQQEGCVACGSELRKPTTRSLGTRVTGKAAHLINRAQRPFIRPQPSWMHMLFEKSH